MTHNLILNILKLHHLLAELEQCWCKFAVVGLVGVEDTLYLSHQIWQFHRVDDVKCFEELEEFW